MPHTRPIHDAEKRNFDTLVSAIKSDGACLVSVADSHTKRLAVLVCAVNHFPDDAEPIELVPLAMLCDGNPYSRFTPPMHEEVAP